MTDEMTFSAPFGILGRVADALFLKSYMRRFLIKHNEHIKKVAEENAKVKNAELKQNDKKQRAFL